MRYNGGIGAASRFGSSHAGQERYADWTRVQRLATHVDAFTHGAVGFLTRGGISATSGAGLVAIVVVSSALTTLDSATRRLRFRVEEIAATLRIRGLSNPYASSAMVVGVIAFLASRGVNARPVALWALFGATNQLPARLTLVSVTPYLRHRRWPRWPTQFLRCSCGEAP